MEPVKVSELTAPALDWAVAKCDGKTKFIRLNKFKEWEDLELTQVRDDEYTIWNPSTDWAQGGPIIEREAISIEFGRAEFKSAWIAYKLGTPHEDNPEGGPTPLIAAMRCYVASKLGNEVEIPAELHPSR